MTTDPEDGPELRGDDPPMPRTQRSLPIALLRARESVMGPMRKILLDTGLNEQKWRVLRVLLEKGPMELTPLAAEACLLLPSLTRMVPPMEEEELVRRSTPPEDRRRVSLEITAKGKALVLSHLPDVQAVFDEIDRKFGHERLEELLDLLEELQRLGIEADGKNCG